MIAESSSKGQCSTICIAFRLTFLIRPRQSEHCKDVSRGIPLEAIPFFQLISGIVRPPNSADLYTISNVCLQAFPSQLQCLLCGPWRQCPRKHPEFLSKCIFYNCPFQVPGGTMRSPSHSDPNPPKTLLSAADLFSGVSAVTSFKLLLLVTYG